MQTPVIQISEVGNPGNKMCPGHFLRNSEEASVEREIVIGPVCGSTTLQEWHKLLSLQRCDQPLRDARRTPVTFPSFWQVAQSWFQHQLWNMDGKAGWHI